MAFILASASPRRKELFSLITPTFSVVTADVDETIFPGTSPHQAVEMLSRQKALAVSQQHPQDIVIGSDTVVALKDRILGKPHDRQDAIDMLRALSGQTHTVFTGVCIVFPGKEVCFYERTDVTFAQMDAHEIENYVASGDCYDKAGAYGIQGIGARYISRIVGDYYTVMGLPVQALYQALRQNGLLPPN